MNPQLEKIVELYLQWEKQKKPIRLLCDDDQSTCQVRPWDSKVDSQHYGLLRPKSAMLLIVEPDSKNGTDSKMQKDSKHEKDQKDQKAPKPLKRWMPYDLDVETLEFVPVSIMDTPEHRELAKSLNIETDFNNYPIESLSMKRMEVWILENESSSQTISPTDLRGIQNLPPKAMSVLSKFLS